MEETKGVLLFNKGEKCIVRAIVALYSIRQQWDYIFSRRTISNGDAVC